MVLKSRKVHLLASYTLMQVVCCNHGMFQRRHTYTLCCPHVMSMSFNKHRVRHLVMRICASQGVSLLFYPITLYWQSFPGVRHCNIRSLMCVEHLWKLVFNGSGAVRTLPFVLRVIHLVTRICGSQGVSLVYSCLVFLDSKILSDPFLFSNSAYHNILFKHFLKPLNCGPANVCSVICICVSHDAPAGRADPSMREN